MRDLQHARERMVTIDIAGRGVKDERILDALRHVPREEFVERALRDVAYEDSPLPIAEGQTISQPFIVAYMIDAAKLQPGDRVLEIGAGSGYAAAVMARIAGKVLAVERHAALGEAAGERLRSLGFDNIEVLIGDGSKGWPERAPFDAIIVAAGSPGAPEALKEQLVIGGRLIIPIGEEHHGQRLVRVTRMAADSFEEEDLGGVRFVPLIGEQGWGERSAGEARLP